MPEASTNQRDSRAFFVTNVAPHLQMAPRGCGGGLLGPTQEKKEGKK